MQSLRDYQKNRRMDGEKETTIGYGMIFGVHVLRWLVCSAAAQE